MHPSSMMAMEHLAGLVSRNGIRVLDVGAAIAVDGNPCYRPLFEALGAEYVGLDLQPGPNVDVVAEDPYRFPLQDGSFDIVISGQAFEHIEFPWLTIREVARVMKGGGLAIIIAPNSGPEHRFPQDCWRFYPDGMRALAKWAGLECVHVETDWDAAKRFKFGDTIGVLSKGSPPRLKIRIPKAPQPKPMPPDRSVAMRLKRAYWALAGH